MWSMHCYPFLKPACSWRSSLYTAVVMRWRMMRQVTLLMMDSSVMPLLLLHSVRFPLLGNLIIVPLFKRQVSPHCPRCPGGCVEETVAFPVLLLSLLVFIVLSP